MGQQSYSSYVSKIQWTGINQEPGKSEGLLKWVITDDVDSHHQRRGKKLDG